MKNNLYMPVYQRIENEVISLINSIFFDDKQKDVYSLAIGDIIIRCVVDIEAISKELYIQLGGNPNPIDSKTGEKRDLYFDTDCIQLLVEKWSLNKKKIQISHPNMFFSNPILTPLHKANKRGTSGSKWKQAYQAFKHNRTQNLMQATIWNMLNALGALYVLNLYYSDESFWFDDPIEKRRKYTVSSEIFTPVLYDATKLGISLDTDSNPTDHLTASTESDVATDSSSVGQAVQTDNSADNQIEESVFILKYTNEAHKAFQKALCKIDIRARKKFRISQEYKSYIEQHPEDRNRALSEIAPLVNFDYERQKKHDAWILREPYQGLKRQEVILNKGSNIYPKFSLEDFLASDEGREYFDHIENNPNELDLVILN